VEELGVEVTEASPRRVLRARGSIVHLHWPEALWNDARLWRAAARSGAMVVLLAFARLRGNRVIWTAHNLEAHERRHPRAERLFWRAFTRQVDGVLALSDSGLEAARRRNRALARVPGFVAPIGHFRDVYAVAPPRSEARASLGLGGDQRIVTFVGRIRPYKGVPCLIRAFRGMLHPAAALVVAGSIDDDALERAVRDAAGGDPDVRLELRYLEDAELPVILGASDLVALPFRETQNSASAILALSFDRPVLVPAMGALPELQQLVGSEWVRTYEGDLRPDDLASALEWATAPGRPERPDLAALDWVAIAERTVAAYRVIMAPGID